MVFAKYGKIWIASTYVGSVTIEPYHAGWAYSGPGLSGRCGPNDIEHVIEIVKERYARAITRAYEALNTEEEG